MALTICKECKKEVSDTAKACPHCGAKLKGGFFGKFLIVIVILFILINLFTSIKNDKAKEKEAERIAALTPEQREAELKAKAIKEEKEKRASRISGAQYVCQQFVLRSLHDPKSAEPENSSQYFIEEESNGIYLVQVTGRFKNGFGALRYGVFNCKTKLDKDEWVLVSLKQIK